MVDLPNAISVLVVGAGAAGLRQLAALSRTGCTDVWLCDADPVRRRAAADRFHVSRTTDDLLVALSWDPRVAVVCVPAEHRIAAATSLIERNVHTLIEQPLGTSLNGLIALEKASRTRPQTVVAVSYPYREHPGLQSLKSALDAGTYGSALTFTAECGCDRLGDSSQDAIQQYLGQLINVGEWLVGPVDYLSADSADYLLSDESASQCAHVSCRHGATLGSYALRPSHLLSGWSLTVGCVRAIVRCDLQQGLWNSKSPTGSQRTESFSVTNADELEHRQMVRFLGAVAGTATVGCDLADGVRTLRSYLALLSASRLKQWIHPHPPRWPRGHSASGG